MIEKDLIAIGSSCLHLKEKVARETNLEVISISLTHFPNGEKRVHIDGTLEKSRVFLIQSFRSPVDEHIIEVCLLADALKRKGVSQIHLIIPWLGYSAQDKVFQEGEPLSSKVITDILGTAEFDSYAVIDVHSNSTLGLFNKPTNHLSALELFVDRLRTDIDDNSTVVALDKGAEERASNFANEFNLPLALFQKERNRVTGEVSFESLSGDVQNRKVFSFDDFISTGGTRLKGSEILKQKGAKEYIDCVTHLLVEDTIPKLDDSSIDKIYITDTIHHQGIENSTKIEVISVTPIISTYIKTIISTHG